jgi:two-component system sensor histidine kinase UhpB
MITRTRRRAFEFPHEYAAALRDYLKRNDETALRRAYELGRQALTAKIGVLDMARLHHDAFMHVSRHLPTGAGAETMNAATRFFVESLTPFEMTHRGFGDVTAALRASDERFRELFENANDAVFMTDLAGNVLSMNRAGERVTGYTSDEIRSMNFARLVAPERVDVLGQILRRTHAEPEDSRYELDIVTKDDGRRVPLEISIRVITHDGQPVGIQGIARDITDRREAARALRAVNQRLEEEARRIAHALHDEAAQLLASVYLALDALADDLPPDARVRLAEIRALLEQVEAQLRRLSHELRPTILDDFGLIPALRFLAEGISKRTGLSVIVTGSTGGRLPTQVETVLYRIVQEGLTNVTKHAQANRAVICLDRDPEQILCSIGDDGRGFQTSTRRRARRDTQGLGLIGIEERIAAVAGTLSIESSASVGTTLKIAIPLKSGACHSESSLLTTT